jgi:enamine deaminase RidA (YjgF/YER057c/UK114 family)
MRATSLRAGRPARTCVGVTALARGARVEIDFVARRGPVE